VPSGLAVAGAQCSAAPELELPPEELEPELPPDELELLELTPPEELELELEPDPAALELLPDGLGPAFEPPPEHAASTAQQSSAASAGFTRISMVMAPSPL
jgi:hypothetical protein